MRYQEPGFPALLATGGCAAFIKESRSELASANNTNRKSGKSNPSGGCSSCCGSSVLRAGERVPP